MKWPEKLALIRHDVSEYNDKRNTKHQDPLFQEFLEAFKIDPNSSKTIRLARLVQERYASRIGDQHTPLKPLEVGETSRSEKMATKLRTKMPLPDVIFVSPYLRTKQTLQRMMLGWPQLQDVYTVDEYRIMEQDHGIAQIYGDFRVFGALNPNELALYKLLGGYWYKYPQGERVPDVQERLRSWVSTLTREFNGMVVLAVLHHLSILALRANLERWNEAQFLEANKNNRPDNASVTIYKGIEGEGSDGKLRLLDYNLRLFE